MGIRSNPIWRWVHKKAAIFTFRVNRSKFKICNLCRSKPACYWSPVIKLTLYMVQLGVIFGWLIHMDRFSFKPPPWKEKKTIKKEHSNINTSPPSRFSLILCRPTNFFFLVNQQFGFSLKGFVNCFTLDGLVHSCDLVRQFGAI